MFDIPTGIDSLSPVNSPNVTEIKSPENELVPILHSDVTVIFGQGPVQEYSEGQNKVGRTGLNFFSRLNAIAAAEMLIQGKTETVILSGGATGAKGEATEADLLADVIRKRLLTTLSTIKDESKRQRLTDILNTGIKIENTSNDTVQNFVNVLNQYIDTDSGGPQKTMTMLGIGFHTDDTHSGAGIGRIKRLAEIFNVEGQVVSAENVLRSLSSENRTEKSYIVQEIKRLTDIAQNHEVAIGKSRQEGLLVDLLDLGDWLADKEGNSKIAKIKNPARLKHMLQSSPFIASLLQKARDYSAEEAQKQIADINPKEPDSLAKLQAIVADIAPLVKDDEEYKNLQAEYGKTKGAVLESFEQLRNKRVKELLDLPNLTDAQVNEHLELMHAQAAVLKERLKRINGDIEEARAQNFSASIITDLITERVALLTQLDPLNRVLIEDKYRSDKTYMMQYGKGEDPRKKSST